ncbi:ATPase family AAA domain-containing protein 2 [Anthophora retusa]
MSGVKDFSCIGGLEKHIRVVKETVLFPLMYGDIYAKFNLKPPRGLLFYGPPGTGKTLVASALAVECSNSERKVSFISRKGSDCLSKWVGESEKKLQKIFSLAQQSKPCIIFFDEVDGLAPVRSNRQDFVHASIVSTLLALMDGLDNNSEIIVIGATNRIDAIDPALRRPGRFDRELYFPLPCYTARKEILSVHVKTWKQKPPQKFFAYLASKTIGFCGSDLQALCAEAVMCCVRRNYPEIYTSKAKYQINERHLKVEKQDFMRAQQNIMPASHRVSVAPVKSLSFKVQPLMQDNLSRILSQLEILCPTGMLICDVISGRAVSRSNSCPRILLCGDDNSHTRHLGPALLHTLEHLPCHVLDIMTLFEETGRAAEEAIIQKLKMARRSLPSLLYIPDILAWWDLVDEAARVVFTSMMQGLDQSVHMLILTTANCTRGDLPADCRIVLQNTDKIIPTIEEALSYRRNRLRARSKICAVRSAHVMTTSKSKLNVKRKGSASGTGPPSKRTKNISASNLSVSSSEKLTDSQTEELLRKIVEATDAWPCYDLESLYTSLELTLDKNEENLCTAVEECLEHFKELRKIKVTTKKEEED